MAVIAKRGCSKPTCPISHMPRHRVDLFFDSKPFDPFSMRQPMRLKLLTLALALAALPLTGRSEDLLDAYREARANDPVLSQSDATRLSVSEGVTQARALLLPQIGASYGLTQSSGSSSGGRGTGTGTG